MSMGLASVPIRRDGPELDDGQPDAAVPEPEDAPFELVAVPGLGCGWVKIVRQPLQRTRRPPMNVGGTRYSCCDLHLWVSWSVTAGLPELLGRACLSGGLLFRHTRAENKGHVLGTVDGDVVVPRA